ncbi:IS6 family transposase [Shewanella sp. YLB-07]|uniref:IS6 family transposase n=1 Tax=Shewanella sp. YLB-07 TaxID=2601268 RepID=UPI00128DF011|nr:IS6 family transposase [Shewanella sp. YLB-07]MPY21141.1 IS6 family transposase [Shewanella sp. YLB-07]MPY21928.1 IS6 family transposase [Shewanella sp. YLB-07]
MALSFAKKQFPSATILMAVRWYVAYKLSYRDIEELLAERGVHVDHATLHRWVLEYAPLLEAAFRNSRKRAVSGSWRMDETYIKVKGLWFYLYRAVDKYGDTIDFMLSEKRDEAAARDFFNKAIGQHGLPEKVVIDKSGSNSAALDNLNWQLWFAGIAAYIIEVLQVKYLNNIVEQSHRAVKWKMRTALGFKSMAGAEATIVGVELWQMLRKGQMKDAGEMTLWEQFYSLAA